MSHAGIELGLTGCELGVVDGDARVLHDGEGRSHGHLQICEELHGVTGRHLLVEHGLEREQDSGTACTVQAGRGNGVGGEGLQVEGALRLTMAIGRLGPTFANCGQVDTEPSLGEGVDVIATLLGTAQVAGQREVRSDTVQCDSASIQSVPAPLGVSDQLGSIDVGEHVGQGGLVLGQDLGQIDGDRSSAVRE